MKTRATTAAPKVKGQWSLLMDKPRRQYARQSLPACRACKSREIPALFPHIFTSKHPSHMTFARFHFYFYFSYPSPKAEEKR